jgi:hypothetical protein
MTDLKEELTVAGLVVERMKQSPGVRIVVNDAHLFDDLQAMPGWKRLYDRVKADKARVMEGVAERLMRGKKITPEEIEFYRGFYQGAVFVLEHPAQAEKNLERVARAAWLLVQSASEAEEATPNG